MKSRFAAVLFALIITLCAGACAQRLIPLPDPEQDSFSARWITEAAGTLYFVMDDKRMGVLPPDGAFEIIPILNHNPEMTRITPALLAWYGLPKGMEMPQGDALNARGISRVVPGGESLYALNDMTGALYRLSLSDGQAELNAACFLDLKLEDVPGTETYVEQALIVDGELLVIVSWTLYGFDMQTGARTQAKAWDVKDIQPYRGGKALLLGWDGAVSAYDPRTGKSDRIDTGAIKDIDRVFYDSTNDRIIVCADSRLTALLADGAQLTVGHWQPRIASWMATLPGGQMAVHIFGSRELRILDISRAVPDKKHLHIASAGWQADESGFVGLYPEILLRVASLEPEKMRALFSQQMTVASAAYDIYEIALGRELQHILEKGYAVPLQSSTQTDAFFSAVHPFVAQRVIVNGQACALPVHLENQTVAYSRHALAQLGIAPEELPGTYLAFLDFCLAFNEKYGDAAREKGVSLFAQELLTVSFDLGGQIAAGYYQLFTDDLQAARAHEKDFAALIGRLARLRKMAPDAVVVGAPYEPPVFQTHNPPMRYRVNAEPDYLFTVTASALPDSRHYVAQELVGDFIPMPLGLFEGMPPQLVLSGSALILNPYSENRQEAQLFLAYCAAHFPGADAASFLTDAQPVRERDYGYLQRLYTSAIVQYQERLQFTLDEAEKADLTYQMDAAQAALKTVDAQEWAVRPEWIADYHQILARSQIVWMDETVLEEGAREPLLRMFQTGGDSASCAGEIIKRFGRMVRESGL